MTAQDLINTAFLYCGQMLPGGSNNADTNAVGLARLQAMYDTWNAQRTMQFSNPDYVFPITGPGTGTTGNGQSFGGTGYTFGPGGDFDTGSAPRPPAIIRMNLYLTSSSPSEPTRIPISLISMEEWMDIPVIQIPAVNVALVAAYDPQWPKGVIWVWPPLNGNSLEIYTWGFLNPPSTLGSTVSIPQGYQELIEWRLAQRLWPICTKDIMPHKMPLQYINGQAKLAQDRVMSNNRRAVKLRCDFQANRQSQSPECNWDLLLAGVPY